MGKDQDLLEAARNGQFSTVEKILISKAKRSGPLASLRRGPGANVQDASGYSALHHAALNGHKEIVQLLLSNEASTNIVDVKGSSPLHLAAWSGRVDIVRMLLCHGPSIPNVNLMTKDNETALHCAAQYGHTEVVCLLLEHSCDPTIRNTKQETALDLAAQYGRLETVDMLVRTHPELIQPYNGYSTSSLIFPHTPLHLASRNGHKAVVEVLLNGGMNVNVRTGSGTALHEAAMCGKTEVVRTLLENGTDLNIRDSQNRTVIDVLKQFPGHVVQEIYSLIKKYREMSNEHTDLFQTNLLNSPFDNLSCTLDSASPCSVSPMHFDSYERRTSLSGASDISYHRHAGSNYGGAGLSKSLLDTNYFDEYIRSPDCDSVSICSTTSSCCSRRSPHVHTRIGAQLPSPGSISNKISPTPPKKPPRRTVPMSPTHVMSSAMFSSSEQNGYDAYDYAFCRMNQYDDQIEYCNAQYTNGNRKTREILRRGKSAEHYADSKFRHSVSINLNEKPNVMIRGKSEDLALLDSKFQPVAITSVCGNIPYRTTNPRRKLRRHTNDKNSEAYDPSVILSRGDLPFRKVSSYEPNISPITIERILVASVNRSNSLNALKASRESLLKNEKKEKKPLKNCPLSPTHYQQPPTPDHPPPSAILAEKRIHDRIRPLSQEYSNLKRKSRDIETETEEELLLLVFPGSTYDATSTGSLSSNISLSDKSVSTDNNTVEEFVGDAPFAGLLKGSVTPDSEFTQYGKLERPTSLNRLRNIHRPNDVVVNGYDDCQKADSKSKLSTSDSNDPVLTNGNEKSVSMSILSPFDEQEEWAKISEIMASFGSSFDRESMVTELEQEFQSRLGFNRHESIPDTPIYFSSVGQWLKSLELSELEHSFINFGYDDINFINGVINDCDLKEIGLNNENNRETILKSVNCLPNKVADFWASNKLTNNGEKNGKDIVKEWLNSINLLVYLETFRKNSYTEMDRIKRIWEVELTAVLEISKAGHRRRILASVNAAKLQNSQSLNDLTVSANLDDLHADLDQLKSNIQELEEEIRLKNTNSSNKVNGSSVVESGTMRHRKKSRPAPPPPPVVQEPDLEIRNPSELLVGVPLTLKAQWRHKPATLVIGTVDYIASYLGSTVVKELRGTESTRKSIQKLKKSTSVVDCRITPEIILAISYRGVKFLNVADRSSICEHEIRNIHCACQDSEDLTHFAYITKDRASQTHYCHVFCVQTMDQATEVILTLGEAFEVAYQMALKEHFGNNRSSIHTRSHSLTNASSIVSHSRKYVEEVAKYFIRDNNKCLPILTLIAQGKSDIIKKLLGIDNSSDEKMLKELVFLVANKAFRDENQIEKTVGDEVYSCAINELKQRSHNISHLVKYYHTSFAANDFTLSSNGASCGDRSRKIEKLFTRVQNGRVPIWTMIVEEKYEELGVLFELEGYNEVDTLKRIGTDLSCVSFRDNYYVTKDVADEVFECVKDELCTRAFDVDQLTQLYHSSFK